MDSSDDDDGSIPILTPQGPVRVGANAGITISNRSVEVRRGNQGRFIFT